MSEDLPLGLPEWFVLKWREQYHFGHDRDGRPGLPLASRSEKKFYDGPREEILTDLQRIIAAEKTWRHGVDLVLLH
ncbi:hypothetical protein ABLE94_02020 [Gordonia sp. VNK1]|jgi:hypothetical protein|uniref:hypothetical protein n=1 Tax=Gordonia oleivorans TaxID=3156618 RepID=UPI0032B3D3EC